MPRITRHRLRVELRDLIELVLVPGLAAVLPWRWCFALFKRLARIDWFYRHASHEALRQAQVLGQVPPGTEAEWLATRRLVTLVDHADYYLAITRSDAYMRRHMRVLGQWPSPEQAGVLLSFHWGAGMWALRHAGAQGMKVHALVAAVEGAPFLGRKVLHRYAIARTAQVGVALRHSPLVISGSLRPVVQALRSGEQVLGLVDVPADQAEGSSLPITVCGMAARVPKGLLRLAFDMQVPVTVYINGFDVQTGQRFLRMEQIPSQPDLQTLADVVFQRLNGCMDESKALWHFWSEAHRFFKP
jgi:hypothetical protein